MLYTVKSSYFVQFSIMKYNVKEGMILNDKSNLELTSYKMSINNNFIKRNLRIEYDTYCFTRIYSVYIICCFCNPYVVATQSYIFLFSVPYKNFNGFIMVHIIVLVYVSHFSTASAPHISPITRNKFSACSLSCHGIYR